MPVYFAGEWNTVCLYYCGCSNIVPVYLYCSYITEVHRRSILYGNGIIGTHVCRVQRVKIGNRDITVYSKSLRNSCYANTITGNSERSSIKTNRIIPMLGML